MLLAEGAVDIAAEPELKVWDMDVLYDLENGIYTEGAGGVIEAAINLITLAFSVTALRWAWSRRDALLSGAAA